MNAIYCWCLRLRLWDCDFAIQRCNTRIAALREEIDEREQLEAELQTALFAQEHSLHRGKA